MNVNQLGINSASPTNLARLDVVQTTTETAAVTATAAQFTQTCNPASASGASQYGALVSCSYTSNQNNTADPGVIGLNSIGQNQGVNTVASVIAVRASGRNTSSGVVTSSYGITADCRNTNAGGTITNAYGLAVTNLINSGTVTNMYGVYVGDITTGTQTNKYNIYLLDGGADNILNGKTRLGSTAAPTSILHLAAGTASANTAPLKFTTGTNLTTPEDGAVEYNGTDYFASVSTTRYTLPKTLTGSASLNFGSTLAGTSADLTITVTGAADGDVVMLGPPNGSVNANTCYTAWVSGTNTVTVRFNNYSILAVDPASGTFKVSVIK
jgi:hypothetical protein